jgi:hypothetical protein
MKAFAVILIFALSGCSSMPVLRTALIKGNNTLMDDARQVICNNVYNAEERARKRWGVDEVFNEFCGRIVSIGR